MNPYEEKKQVEPYLDVPCAGCGEHYWKIPNKKGHQELKCPKCRGKTRIEIGEDLRIFRVTDY